MDIIWDDPLDLNHETNRDSLVPLGRFAPAVHSLLVAEFHLPTCCLLSYPFPINVTSPNKSPVKGGWESKPVVTPFHQGMVLHSDYISSDLRFQAPRRSHGNFSGWRGHFLPPCPHSNSQNFKKIHELRLKTLQIQRLGAGFLCWPSNQPEGAVDTEGWSGCTATIFMFFHVFSTWKSVTKVGRNLTSSARKRRKRRKELHWKVNFSVPCSAVPTCWAGEIWRPERGRQPGTWVIGHIVWNYDIFGSKKIGGAMVALHGGIAACRVLREAKGNHHWVPSSMSNCIVDRPSSEVTAHGYADMIGPLDAGSYRPLDWRSANVWKKWPNTFIRFA